MVRVVPSILPSRIISGKSRRGFAKIGTPSRDGAMIAMAPPFGWRSIDSVIDGSFVAERMQANKQAAIVQGVISLAHDPELAAVAEGAENAARLEFLQGLGCDRAQGFFTGERQPIGETLALYENG